MMNEQDRTKCGNFNTGDLLFGDTPDLRGQYFGPGSIIPPQNKTEVILF